MRRKFELDNEVRWVRQGQESVWLRTGLAGLLEDKKKRCIMVNDETCVIVE